MTLTSIAFLGVSSAPEGPPLPTDGGPPVPEQLGLKDIGVLDSEIKQGGKRGDSVTYL